MSEEQFIESFNKISLKDETIVFDSSKLLYISFKCDKSLILDIIKLFNLSNFNIQTEFHITILYTGCKKDERILQLTELFNNSFSIEIDRIAISDKFIVLGINGNNIPFPYFGNKTIHITVGSEKGKKLRPADSPTAFSEGVILTFEKPYIMNGIIKPIYR
jgi:hypothetical protein